MAGVPTSILSVPCRIWACSHCCMEGTGPVGAMGRGAGGVVQQAGLVRAVSHRWLSLPGWDRHSHPASRCTCQSHLGSTKQPTSTAKPASLTQGHLLQHLARPGAHLQQARTGVGQAAMGAHHLCKYLMYHTLFLAKGCRGLGVLGPLEARQPTGASTPAALCIPRRCVHTSTIWQQSLALMPAPPAG